MKRDRGHLRIGWRCSPSVVLYGLFLASGATALVYELCWLRLLSLELGNTVESVSVVLSVFMAGFAAGSWALGKHADRIPRPLALYATLELGIGVYAYLFTVVWSVIRQSTSSPVDNAGTLAVLVQSARPAFCVFLVLPATILMGGTFPALAKTLNADLQAAGRRLGTLYGLNIVGAVCGCLLEAYVTVPQLGIRMSILSAAAVNVGIGAVCFAFTWLDRSGRYVFSRASALRDSGAGQPCESTEPEGGRFSSDDRDPNQTHDPIADQARSTLGAAPVPEFQAASPVLLTAVAFASGFLILATEVCWTRIFITFLTGNVVIVATVLAGFLAGLGLGSLGIAIWIDRLRRLDLVLGGLLLACAAWLVASVVGQTELATLFDRLIGEPDAWFGVPAIPALIVLFTVVALPATIFGTVMPLLLRWCLRAPATLASDVGRLAAWNTVGAIFGPILGGYVAIRLFGVNASILMLVLGYNAMSLWVLRRSRVGVTIGLAAATVVAGVVLPCFYRPVFWFNGGFRGVGRVSEEDTLFLREGIQGTVGVARSRGVLMLAVNGLVVAETSQRDLWDLLLKAHLPMLLHANPRRVALVGLGAGVSLGAVLSYEVEHVDCAEISPDVADVQGFFRSWNAEGLNDERVRLWCTDGRRLLARTSERYDVISVDPVDPPVCNLYTQDFIQLCHDRLEPGGIMVQWVPLFHLSSLHVRIVAQGFLNVFPDACLWYDGTSVLLVGCRDQPLSIEVSRFLDRAEQTRVGDSLALVGRPAPILLLACYVTDAAGLLQMLAGPVPVHTDDRPYLEYSVLLSGRLQQDAFARNLELVAQHYRVDDARIRLRHATPSQLEQLRESRRLLSQLFQVRLHRLRGSFGVSESMLDQITTDFKLTQRDLAILSPFYDQ